MIKVTNKTEILSDGSKVENIVLFDNQTMSHDYIIVLSIDEAKELFVKLANNIDMAQNIEQCRRDLD